MVPRPQLVSFPWLVLIVMAQACLACASATNPTPCYGASAGHIPHVAATTGFHSAMYQGSYQEQHPRRGKETLGWVSAASSMQHKTIFCGGTSMQKQSDDQMQSRFPYLHDQEEVHALGATKNAFLRRQPGQKSYFGTPPEAYGAVVVPATAFFPKQKWDLDLIYV